jgi:hypothetical protein
MEDFLNPKTPKARKRRRPSLATFPRAFAKLLSAVSTHSREIELGPFETPGMARNLRQRLYLFRSCLEDEGHDLYDLCAGITIPDPYQKTAEGENSGLWWMTIRPHDSAHSQMIEDVLSKIVPDPIPFPEPVPVPVPTPTPTPVLDAVNTGAAQTIDPDFPSPDDAIEDYFNGDE